MLGNSEACKLLGQLFYWEALYPELLLRRRWEVKLLRRVLIPLILVRLMEILAMTTVKVLLPMMMPLVRLILVVVMILLLSLVLRNCLFFGLLLVVLIFIIEWMLLFLKNLGLRNNLLNLLELFQVLLQCRVIMIVLVVLVIASLESPDQLIIILIAILLLSSFRLCLVTAPPLVGILLGVLTLLVVRELMNVPLARVVDSIVVVVATELIEALLIKEVSIGVIESLVVRQYVEVHLIIIPALDLFHLAHCLLRVCRLLFVMFLRPRLTAGLGLLIFFRSSGLVFLLATREVNFDLLCLLSFVSVPFLLFLDALCLGLFLGLFLSGLLDIFSVVFHLIYNKLSGGRQRHRERIQRGD